MDDETTEAPLKRKPGRPKKVAAPAPANGISADDLTKIVRAVKEMSAAPEDDGGKFVVKVPKTPEEVAEINESIRELGTPSDDEEKEAERRAYYRALRQSRHEVRCQMCWSATERGESTTITIDVPSPRAAGRQNPHYRIGQKIFPKGQHTVRRCEAATLAWLIDQNHRVDRDRMGPGGRGEGKVYNFDLDKGLIGERARVIQADD